MPSGSSPLEKDIELATSASNKGVSLDLLIALGDSLNALKDGSARRSAAEVIERRLRHPTPSVSMQCLELLGVCVRMCSDAVLTDIFSKQVIVVLAQEATQPRSSTQAMFISRMAKLVEEWVIEAEHRTVMRGPALQLYVSLGRSGVPFGSAKAAKIAVRAVNGSSAVRGGGGGSASASAGRQQKKVTFQDQQPQPAQSSGAMRVSQEEFDLSKAIELSLKESQSGSGPKSSGTASNSGSAGGGMYPTLGASSVASPSSTVSSSKRHSGAAAAASTPVNGGARVRALYDFEAAEDNELSFKAGELINLLDASSETWWKGATLAASGWFPSNFVTTDLSAPPEQHAPKSDQGGSVHTAAGTRQAAPAAINESKIKLLLEMLHGADARVENEQEDATIRELEGECESMRPLIQTKAKVIDAELDELHQLNHKLLGALSHYQHLMQDMSQHTSTVLTTSALSAAPQCSTSAAGVHVPPLTAPTSAGAPRPMPVSAAGHQASSQVAAPPRPTAAAAAPANGTAIVAAGSVPAVAPAHATPVMPGQQMWQAQPPPQQLHNHAAQVQVQSVIDGVPATHQQSIRPQVAQKQAFHHHQQQQQQQQLLQQLPQQQHPMQSHQQPQQTLQQLPQQQQLHSQQQPPQQQPLLHQLPQAPQPQQHAHHLPLQQPALQQQSELWQLQQQQQQLQLHLQQQQPQPQQPLANLYSVVPVQGSTAVSDPTATVYMVGAAHQAMIPAQSVPGQSPFLN